MSQLDHEDKLAQVYRLYRAPMLRLALRVTGQEHDAEDAVHDAFESIAKNLDKFAEADSPRTRGYVMVITERKAIDLVRGRQSRPSQELDEDAVSIDFPNAGENSLAACMAKLPPRYREILLLRFVYGYSMRETAELMGVPFTTVGKLSQRAKERLYELCRREGVL